MTSPYVLVSGSGETTAHESAAAEAVGALLARRGAIVLCGGLGGVMEAACRGARSAGGTTVGILPGFDRSDANAYLDVALPTGLGELRNPLLVRACDAVIAVGGGWGTLSEIAFALKLGVPVVGIGAFELVRDGRPVEAYALARNPEEAVELALTLAAR